MAQTGGVFSWGSPGAGKHIPKKFHIIRQRLRALTGLRTNPFWRYVRKRGYKARFKIEDISEITPEDDAEDNAL
jgi:hypothetical protein